MINKKACLIEFPLDNLMIDLFTDFYRCHCQPTLKIKGAALKLLDSYDINNSSNVNSKAVATIVDDLPQYHMIVSTRNWNFRFGIDSKPQLNMTEKVYPYFALSILYSLKDVQVWEESLVLAVKYISF